MRQLRIVGRTEDGNALILEADGASEQFALANDDALRQATSRVDTTPIGGTVTESATALSPREIQTRIRAGEDPTALADECNMPLDKIMRFAHPVLQERIRVTDEARRGRARVGGDGSPTPFGPAIDHRFAIHGIEPNTVAWDSYRREDGGWTVTARFSAQDKAVLARFGFTLANRNVSALDDVAADLLSDRPVRVLMPEQPEPVNTLDSDEERPSPARLAAVPDLDESPPTPAGRRPSRRQRAHTHPLPASVEDELFDQEAFDDFGEPALPLDFDNLGSGTGAATPDPGRASAEANATTVLEPSVEPTADSETDPYAAESAPTNPKRKSGDKPRMPSWDDILLGVRRKTE
jgi:hypothetical protein